jgi:hypothetical protein
MPADNDQQEFEAWVARFTRDLESGEIQIPAEGQQRMWFSVAGTDDPAALGPEAFAQHGPLDEATPDGLLASQVTAMASDEAALAGMSDDAILGLVAAGRRLAARGAAVQQRAVAEFARRREPVAGARPSRKGFTEFAADELAWQLVLNHNQAEAVMDQAQAAQKWLPKICALLWDGRLSEWQMSIIASGTRFLADDGAAEADSILAASVADLTPGQTRALVARVVLMIDPEGAKERKKDAAGRARVEKFRELSGTAALCGRDLPPDAVLAGYQHIDARARAMKAAGYKEDLERLRAAVYLALLTGRDTATMLTALSTAAGDPIPGACGQSQWPCPDEGENSEQDGNGEGEGGSRRPRQPAGPQPPAGPAGGQLAGLGTEGTGAAPFAAIINLQVPAATLFEQGTAPGEIPGYGPLDPETTRDLVQIASAHPRTRWCVTTIGEDATAKEHGCVPGQHRWTPPAAQRTGGGNRDGPAPPPDPAHLGPGDEEHQAAAAGFLARLQVKLAPIAAGQEGCDHA